MSEVAQASQRGALARGMTKRRMQPGCRPAKTTTKYGANLAAKNYRVLLVNSISPHENAETKDGEYARCGGDESRTRAFRLRATPFLLAEKKWGKETAKGNLSRRRFPLESFPIGQGAAAPLRAPWGLRGT